MPAIERIRCKECNHENEPERVYCHNCGAKLDRTLVVKHQREQEALRAKEQKKKPRSALAARTPLLKPLFWTLFAAFVAGCLVQMARVPDDMPEMPKDRLDYPPVGMDLADRLISGSAQAARYSEDEVNAYLAGSIKSSSSRVLKDYVKFSRALAFFEDGYCTVGFEQLAFEHPLYVLGSYEVGVKDGALAAESLGGQIGRLPIPAFIMGHADRFVFKQLKDALERDLTTLSRVEAIAFSEDFVDLQIPGGQ